MSKDEAKPTELSRTEAASAIAKDFFFAFGVDKGKRGEDERQAVAVMAGPPGIIVKGMALMINALSPIHRLQFMLELHSGEQADEIIDLKKQSEQNEKAA